ncbi:MAG TPA: hypothetical protein VF070_16550 [Streptosporangiaceae bacterium]
MASELRVPADVPVTHEEQAPALLTRYRRWWWPAGFVVSGLVLFGIYLRQAQTVFVMSDGASNALQGWDMLHGNLLLRGWTLTDISFYTTELPEYMLTEAARGLGASAAHVAAALTYTLVVIGAAVLAKGRADGREGVVRALVAAGIMLAPPLGGTSATMLNDPDHIGTQVPLLIIWLILDRARPRWPVPVAVAVLLAWGQIADPLVTYEGVLPIVVVCAIRVYRRREHLIQNLPESWYELALAAGAIVSTGVAAVALRLIRQAGGFSVTPPVTTFSPVVDLFSHLGVTAESILLVFGADFSGQQLGPGAAVFLIHLAGVALAGWAVTRALRRFGTSDLVVQVLATAMVVLLAAYTFSGSPDIVGGPHEIAGALPVGAVLAGRLLAGQLISRRHLAALGAVLACYCLVLAHNFVQQPGYDANLQLASWLRTHDLRYGLATYWNASSVTVDSGGQVQVRPVNRGADGRVEAIQRDTLRSWYDHKLHDATFLVMPPSRHVGCAAGTPADWMAQARAQFGPPTATYRADGFTIVVWNNENLLSLIAPPAPGVC